MTFLILVGLIIWVYFDNQICELSRIKNDRIRKIEHILNIELNNDWFIRRYKTICILRYFLLTILFYDNKLIIVGLNFLACLLVYFLPILILERKARIKIKSIRYHFPIYLRQIQVLLQNNTVVKSIELSLEYVPDILRDDIVKLNDKLKLEPNNMSHYVNCMKQYNLVEIQRSMKWLYRYQNFGYVDAYSQFNRMLISTSKWLRQSRIENKNDSIQVYQWMGMLPLIGVTFVFISAMMSVVISLFERG